jgi:hypothetical protein
VYALERITEPAGMKNKRLTGLPGDAKMDDIYLTIPQTCNWEENTLIQGSNLLMAAKTPSPTSALQSLHRNSLTLPSH